MSVGDINITVVGNLTKDPELRYTTSSTAVASFVVASSPRVRDQASGEWKDGPAVFMRCSAWRHLAEHVAETCERGTRVIVTGRLTQREYEDTNGIKRQVTELQVEEVGPSLKYATAKVIKATRGAPGGEPPHPADAWSGDQTSGWGKAQSSADGGWNGGYANDEPPF